MSNPWDASPIVRHAGAATAGNPKLPLELTHSAGENIIQNAEIGRQHAITSKTNSDAARAAYDAAKAAADAHIATPLNAAQLTKAQAEAALAQQKVDETRANNALATMSANSQVHGDAYLKQFVPPQMWNVVKAYARGDLGSRSGGLSTSMLPIIQHAMNYDPSTSGTNFPARVKMQSDLASGDPKSAGGSLQAFERMLLHGENVLDSGLKLNNFHSGIVAPLNYFRLAGEKWKQDPTLHSFDEEVRNYAPEAQKAIASVAGGEGERQERHEAFSGSMSPEAIVAGLQADARQAMGASSSVNDRYKRIMGHDITDALSPQAKRAYDKIMAGGYDKTGKPLHPADDWTPISAPDADGPGGGNPPPAGTGGPSGPIPGSTPATGATKAVDMDPGTAAAITGMLKRHMTAAQMNAVLVPAGMVGPEGVKQDEVEKFQKILDGGGSIGVQYEKPTSLLNRVADSPVGTGTGAAIDGGLGGFTDEATAGIDYLRGKGAYGDLLAQADAKKQAAFGAHPTASTVGNILGTGATALGGGLLLKGAPLVGMAGRAAPYLGGAAYGGISGAGQNNNDRIDGAGLGMVEGLAGTGAGQVAALPLGALARSRPALAATNGVRRMFGANAVQPAQALSPAENELFGAASKAGPDDIRAFLGQASDLGVPASLADSAPQIREASAAAVRRSPTAAQTAENAFIPRNRGQIDRLGAAVNRDLGPTANIPQLSQDLTHQARTAAGPLYDAAYAAPGASSVNLDDLMTRPSMKAGLARAHNIALEEGRNPSTLGFDLNGQGEVTLNRVPSFQTLDYVKRGLDDTLEPHRNPITGKLDLNEATRAINATKSDLLSRIDRVNPDYAAARAAYAGPVQARDALAMGHDALSLSPDEIAMQASGQTPDNLAQMQLGHRSALMGRANKVRDVSNPFEATLGTPNARGQIDALYPNNPGTANLFATRDMEGQIARSANDILGNSKTAQRQIADKTFAGADLGDMLSAGVDLAHGGIPVSTIAKAGAKRAGMFAASKRAVAKADDMAPMVFNTDPRAASAILDDLIAKANARNAFVQQMRPTNIMGYLGGGFGASAAQGF